MQKLIFISPYIWKVGNFKNHRFILLYEIGKLMYLYIKKLLPFSFRIYVLCDFAVFMFMQPINILVVIQSTGKMCLTFSK